MSRLNLKTKTGEQPLRLTRSATEVAGLGIRSVPTAGRLPVLSVERVGGRRSQLGTALLAIAVVLGSTAEPVHARKSASSEDACLADGVCLGLYEEARRLSKSGDFATALAAYQGAYRRRPMPWLLINIGRTLHKLGRFSEALAHYQRYLADEANGPADRLQTVKDYIAQAEKAQAERTAAGSTKPDEPESPARGETSSTPSGAASPTEPSVKGTSSPDTAGAGSVDKGRADAAPGNAEGVENASPAPVSGDAAAGSITSRPASGSATTPQGSSASQDGSAAVGTEPKPDPSSHPLASTVPTDNGSGPPARQAGGDVSTRVDPVPRRPLPAYFWAGIGTGGVLLAGGAALGIAALVDARALQDTPYAGMAPASLIEQQARVRALSISSDVLLAVGGTTAGVVTLVWLIQHGSQAARK